MKFSAFLATSLDGYIADEHHGIAWLDQANEAVPAGEDCGYGAFFASIDAMLMGRKSFDQVMRFPEWPYGNTPVFVLSHSLRELPSNAPPSVTLLSGSPASVAETIQSKGYSHVYVDGGTVVSAFLEAGLLSEITLTLIPVTLGSGIPLFGKQPNPIWFTHLRGRTFPFGFVQNTYRVAATPA